MPPLLLILKSISGSDGSIQRALIATHTFNAFCRPLAHLYSIDLLAFIAKLRHQSFDACMLAFDLPISFRFTLYVRVFFSLAFNSYNFELFLHAFATRLYMHDFHQDKSIDRRQSLFFPFHLLVSLFLLIISLLRLLVWLSDVAVVDAKCCKLKSNKAHLRSPLYVKIDGCTRR